MLQIRCFYELKLSFHFSIHSFLCVLYATERNIQISCNQNKGQIGEE